MLTTPKLTSIEGTTIGFDGYLEDAAKSPKSVEHIKRTKKLIAGNVMFDKLMSATLSKEKFLPNDKNKERLINMLCVKFQKEGLIVEKAEENADYLIIKSALEIEKGSQYVVVNGEDIDILFIMAASCNSEKVFFLKAIDRKSGINCSTICYHCKGQRRKNSPKDDTIITNLATQEAEIDIRMQEIISDVDLEENCQTLQVEESGSKQTDINDYDSPSTSKKLKLIKDIFIY
ncbi:hypothetical protein AVEN_234190-1 [Araneus ventricosus]|uniref:Uncharacterized protein n=1 Tax=Araneus ventricosus TaxID=182803 RepID=A0A4Y2JA21_ARAVE|nr:hypothetical protein AVEN_234190-1 [Araneus ventricosus]